MLKQTRSDFYFNKLIINKIINIINRLGGVYIDNYKWIMTYQEIKQKHQRAYDDIMENAGVFWAFSDKQFEEGLKKANLKKGEKLVKIPAGGFCLKKNIDKLLINLKEADKTKTKELKEAREEKTAAILYELNNHECFYTGDIEPVTKIFKGIYTAKAIVKVYKANAM